jgi:hypothetical protein
MNTFITHNDPKFCAKNLDYKRLGKQRLECIQILNAIKDPNYRGWKNHPCTNMWKTYELSLKYYTNCMIDEWILRGYKNNMEKFSDFDEKMPWWFSLEELQNSHKASLLRKDRDFYKNIFDENFLKDYMDFSYVWISKLSEETIKILQNNEKLHISVLAEKFS